MENVIEDIISESTAGDAADMGQDLPKMPSFGGAGNFKMPSMEEFIKMLENMDNLSDEEKEQLKLDVMKNSMGSRKMEAGLSDYMVFLVMVLLIASVFGKRSVVYKIKFKTLMLTSNQHHQYLHIV